MKKEKVVYLLNGIPTGLIYSIVSVNKIPVFELKTKEDLQNAVKQANLVINAIRHPKTNELISSILKLAREIENVGIVDFGRAILENSNDVRVFVLAPKFLVKRGEEVEVSFDNLAIIEIKIQDKNDKE